MTRTALRPGLPPLPDRLKNLPVSEKGYPIPWFVETLDDGTRDFRVASAVKRVRAVNERLCWICGGKLGRYLAFCLGPMCAINKNTSEPSSHRECAEFAAVACPFLTLPEAQYRRANIPDGTKSHPHVLPGNPGGVVVWVTTSFQPYRVPGAGNAWLINVGPAVAVLWYTQGRLATRTEARKLIDDRVHLLRDAARTEGADAEAHLDRMIAECLQWLPPERAALLEPAPETPAHA